MEHICIYVHSQRLLPADRLRAAAFDLLHRQRRDLPELAAKLQLAHGAVELLDLARECGILRLKALDRDEKRLAEHEHLVLRAAQLPERVGIVLLQLAVADGVVLRAHGVVCLLHLRVLRLIHEHRIGDHHPLRAGDIVEAAAQLLLHLPVVDLGDRQNAFLQRPERIIVLAHPRAQILERKRPFRVRHGSSLLCVLLHVLLRCVFRSRLRGFPADVSGGILPRLRNGGGAGREHQQKREQQCRPTFFHQEHPLPVYYIELN